VGRCVHLNPARVMRLGRMTLRELSQRAGGVDCTTVGAGVSGSARRRVHDPRLRGFVGRVQRELSSFEM
jgi:hypothetical protein